jgi:excinuclease ABC subunit A
MTKHMSRQPPSIEFIELTHVRQNNLKNINVKIPLGKLTVITGLSGSGKSSLAFDTLYAEGQRRYIESLSTYTRQFLEKMPKPDLESIKNIPPAIALEQRNHIVNARSTVGTQTEILDYLRVLYAKVGKTFCLDCNIEVKRTDADSLALWASQWLVKKNNRKAALLAPVQRTPKIETSPKKSKIKSKSKTKAKKTTASSTLTSHTSLIQVLKEQGYSRVVLFNRDSSPVIYECEDPTLIKALETLDPSDNLYVMIDRFKLSSQDLNSDTITRLREATEQALMVGHDQLRWMDLDSLEWHAFDRRFICSQCQREYQRPDPHLFSFNSPLGACDHCHGFGHTLEFDENLIVPQPNLSLDEGALDPFTKPSYLEWHQAMLKFAIKNKIPTKIPYRELTQTQRQLLWNSTGEKSFPGVLGCFKELEGYKYKVYVRVFIRRYQTANRCIRCHGSRLKPDATAVRCGDHNLPQLLDLSIHQILEWRQTFKLSPAEIRIAQEALDQIDRRLHFLDEVGVGYLTLSRLAKTLSGGEFQRISLATQLGHGLCGTLYVLDEPSIGLHPSDTHRLINILHRLRDLGNTVVVVEHDLDVIKAADHVLELGPAAGHKGGQLIAEGDRDALAKNPNSITGKYILSPYPPIGPKESRRPPRGPNPQILKITGCRENNLKNITLEVPLKRFVVLSGMSGSGKSTLLHQTLYPALVRYFEQTQVEVGRYDRLYGAEKINGVIMIDQSPIGRSSRSNPATYLKAWDEMRKIYAQQTLSIRRGYTPQYFSFNVDGGRCPVCKGEGEITLDMHFMAEINIPCEECDGKRFKKNILEVRYKNKNVYELLQTTINEAYELFRDNSILSRKLGLLREVGLGYLQLGQSGSTLSGGESQRLKIASSLDDRDLQNQLYLFDEPTTGLHIDDVKRLVQVVQDLVHNGHSVLMIEHHLDVIAQADWVIDMGPEGGPNGGTILAKNTPAKLADREAIDPSSTYSTVTGKQLIEHGYF